MRKTLRDWKNEWIQTNGETNELEVIIKDSKLEGLTSYVYEGSFKDIPEKLLDKQVIKNWKILESSVPKRIGAYSLMI